MYDRYYKQKDVYYFVLIGLIIISSICSISIQVVEISQNVRNMLNYLPWIITIIYMVIYLNYTNIIHFKMMLLLLLPLGLAILGRFMGVSYDDSLTRALILVSIVFGIGILLGEYLEQKHFDIILKGIVVATLLVGLYTYFVLLGGAGLYESQVGIYNKNALGLIFAVPVVIMLFNNNVFYKLKFIFIPFLVMLVILCASRTSMVCCLVAIIARIFIGNRNWKEKAFYTVVISGVIVFLFTNKAFYDRVITEIFFKGHEEVTEEDYYHVTSGRSEMLKWFPAYFKQNWFIGGGSYAFENFYLDTLCKMGIVGAIPIFMFVFSPIYYFFKDRKEKNSFEIRNMLLALCLLMCINGLGEEMTPLGPGVKCFVLWLSFGYFIGMRNKNKELALYSQEDDESQGVETSEVVDETVSDNTGI